MAAVDAVEDKLRQQQQAVADAAAAPSAATADRYRFETAQAAAAASSTAAALAVVSRIEQGLAQLLLLLVLAYCLCFLPSLLPGLQPQHIVGAMAARPAWFEGLLLALLLVHMYMAGPNNAAGWAAGGSGDAAATGAENAATADASDGPYLAEGAGQRDTSFTTSSIYSMQQQQLAGAAEPGASSRKQHRQERRRQRRRLARQQVLLLRSLLSVGAATAAAGMACYSLWLFCQASMPVIERWQQCRWEPGSTGCD
jgi:hypothetical protein